MNTNPHPTLAEAVRRALIDAAEAAYEDAGIRGLCAEGRWEAAVQAMRGVDVGRIAREITGDADPHPSASGRSDASHG